MSVNYVCKIKIKNTNHLGLKQLKEFSSSCSSKFWNIFYYLLGGVDVLDSLLHVKIIPPWRTQTALVRKASWRIYFIPPPSVKDYAVYLIKRMQPFKSCTLVSIHSHFWQICCGFEWFPPFCNTHPTPCHPCSQLFCWSTVISQLWSLHHFCWKEGSKRCSHQG